MNPDNQEQQELSALEQYVGKHIENHPILSLATVGAAVVILAESGNVPVVAGTISVVKRTFNLG